MSMPGKRMPFRLAHFTVCAISLFLLYFPVMAHESLERRYKEQDEVLLGWRGVTRQSKQNSCGPALLSTISRIVHEPTTEYQLIAKASMAIEGITLAEFARLADGLRYSGMWLHVEPRDGGSLPIPAVVHLETPVGHYAILTTSTDSVAVIKDPSMGLVAISQNQFAKRWSGFFYADQL